MGRSNICTFGKAEGLIYIDYDDVFCYQLRDDFEWVKFDGEDLHYEDVKIRD